MRKFFNAGRRISVLACITAMGGLPLLADDPKYKTESKASASSRAQVEVRVKSNADEKADSEENDKQVTVVLDVSGDQPDVVNKAIEKLERQLKNSGIPEALQQKAVEAMRGQLMRSPGDGNAFSGQAQWSSSGQTPESSTTDKKGAMERRSQSGRLAFQLPFDPLQSGLPNAMVNAFSTSNALGPAQKEKLRDGIREALEEAGVDSRVVEKALQSVDKRLHQFNSQGSFSWNTSGKLPYRVGIGCKVKDEGDTQPGLEVETVFEDTPAAKAGLKQGDRLISIDSQPVHSHDDIVAAVQKAGEENRSVQIEATRGEESIKFEIKPQQTAVAELHSEFIQPGGPSGSPFRGQAWVMPQLPQSGTYPWNDRNIQEKIRDAVNDAMEASRRATENAGPSRGSRKESVSAETQNEKNIDKLQDELKNVHQELEEMKQALKKLAERP